MNIVLELRKRSPSSVSDVAAWIPLITGIFFNLGPSHLFCPSCGERNPEESPQLQARASHALTALVSSDDFWIHTSCNKHV